MFGVCILGTGMISSQMVHALQKADPSVVKLTAIGSREKTKAEALAQVYTAGGSDHKVLCGSYEDVIKSDSVHGVFMGLPTSLKEELAMRCISLGKHVLVDKPYVSKESVERMWKASLEKNLLFMDATHFVHNIRTLELRRNIVENGLIGKPSRINSTFFAGSDIVDPAKGNIR